MKKVIALLLAVLMMLSLSACAQKAGQQNIESKAPEEVAQTESEAPAEDDDRPMHQRLFSTVEEPCVMPMPPVNLDTESREGEKPSEKAEDEPKAAEADGEAAPETGTAGETAPAEAADVKAEPETDAEKGGAEG